MRECFCFGSEAVNASGEAVRGLVPLANSSRNMAVPPPLARSRIPPATQATFLSSAFFFYPKLGSIGLCSKNKVLCFRASPVKQGYYAQNYARLEV